MEKDIRDTPPFQEAQALYAAMRQPGTGQISDATEINSSPDGRHAVFAAVYMDKLEGTPPTRICQIHLQSAEIRLLTLGPNTDRLPKYSPDGKTIAFLSDRHEAGDFQLYLLNSVTGAARSARRVHGWVEYFHWSPDGARILLGVAGRGADIAGGQGAITSRQGHTDAPSWMPSVETGDETYRWRRAWVYELLADSVREVTPADCNIWEAVWCGPKALAAVVSPGPGEGLWYNAKLSIISIETGDAREICRPQDQLGWPAASPSGKQVAVVEAVCSDRGIVAGDLRVIDADSGHVQAVNTNGIDIAHTEWRSERKLLVAGHRGFESVVGHYDAASGEFTESWTSQDITTGGRYIAVSGVGSTDDCVLIGEGFARAPEIAKIDNGKYRVIRSFDLGYQEKARAIGAMERVSWQAPDGLEIQGRLLLPKGNPPFPLVMEIHGGPVWHWRPRWLVRTGLHTLMLLNGGYAVFYPNPRGSAGRGQDFARRVKGEMNGADTHDFLSGLDALVKRGTVDARYIGVMGGSYGGNMTSWLITQDSRFAAAIPIAPHTNQVTEHLISNIPHFVALFLNDHYTNAGGKYFQRSPIMHAHKAKTPTLNICGALDRCTPPEEAVQFHNALLENGCRSVLVTYPEEGHGIRQLPAYIDCAARVVTWFEEHMAAGIKLADDKRRESSTAK